jgi:hypothetical protein
MKIIVSFWRRRYDVMNLNDVARFFAHLTSFHVFWTFSIASIIAFRWWARNVFRIVRFLTILTLLHVWSVCSVFFWATSSFWNAFRTWFVRIRVRLHASSKSKIARIEILNFEMNVLRDVIIHNTEDCESRVLMIERSQK